jgi:hypothetical protein
MGKRQEEFMNAIELLKEAMDELGAVQYYIPPADETAEMTPAITADVDACQRLMTKIEAYLAEPEPDAMEIVRKVRHGNVVAYAQNNDLLHATVEKQYTLTDSEAAALIASLGRRVPRVMLEELAIEILNLADLAWKSGWQEYVKNLLTAIFAKHGVKVEDAK